jgi:hypothetical protein
VGLRRSRRGRLFDVRSFFTSPALVPALPSPVPLSCRGCRTMRRQEPRFPPIGLAVGRHPRGCSRNRGSKVPTTEESDWRSAWPKMAAHDGAPGFLNIQAYGEPPPGVRCRKRPSRAGRGGTAVVARRSGRCWRIRAAGLRAEEAGPASEVGHPQASAPAPALSGRRAWRPAPESAGGWSPPRTLGPRELTPG